MTAAKGNKNGRRRRQPETQREHNALLRALVIVANQDRKAAFKELQKEDPDLADEMFEPVEDYGTAIEDFMINVVKQGKYNDAATKLVLERVFPKPKMPKVTIPGLAEMEPGEAIKEISRRVGLGLITPDVGEALQRVFMAPAVVNEIEASTRAMNQFADEEDAKKS